jgi:hypothetical protein
LYRQGRPTHKKVRRRQTVLRSHGIFIC